MDKKSLKSIIRKHYTTKWIVTLIILIACIILSIFNPYAGRIQLVSVANPGLIESVYENNDRYVHITIDELYYTGIDVSSYKRNSARVYYTVSEDRIYYVILTNSGLPKDYNVILNREIKACLMPNFSLSSELNSIMSDKLNYSPEVLASISSPIIIDQYSYLHSISILFARFVLVLIILAGIHLIIILLTIVKPSWSLALLSLRQYGNRTRIFNAAEEEFKLSSVPIYHDIYYTGSFLIIIRASRIDIIPLENIVWVYQYNELHHKRGYHHISHPICLVSDTKKLYKTPSISKDISKTLIDRIQADYPQIMIEK